MTQSKAMQIPTLSLKQVEQKKAERRRERRQEKTAFFDRFFSFFERVLRFAEREENKTSTPDDDENYQRL
jgi:hypothetical protein